MKPTQANNDPPIVPQVIEGPAKQPREPYIITFTVGALFAWFLVIGAYINPEHEPPPIRNMVSAMMLPLALVFSGAAVHRIARRKRKPPFRPQSVSETPGELRFRFTGPFEVAAGVGFLGLPLAFLPVQCATLLWGDLPVPILALTDLPLVALLFLIGFAAARPLYARGRRDYILNRATGTLHIPAIRYASTRTLATDIRITDFRAVVHTERGKLILSPASPDQPDIVFRVAPDNEVSHACGKWIAGLLGLPFLQRTRIEPPALKRAHRSRWIRLGLTLAYLLLLTASWTYELRQAFGPFSLDAESLTQHQSRPAASISGFDHSGRPGPLITIAYDDFPPASPSHKPPILLLHGSPGRGSEMAEIAAPLAAAGYRVISPDLPGFGDSTHNPHSLSILAHAHEVLALMDQLHIQRAHILGWSLGGGVAMHMADLAPDRVASLTLMASISDQESEGTRSYIGEHAKYAAGYAAATAVRYAIPHFGLLSHFDEIRASMINFWDSDMRRLQALMRRLQTPTLILHGRHDFLVPAWAAEHSHKLIANSELVMTPYSHFFPFMQPDYAAAKILAFIELHNTPNIPSRGTTTDLAPDPPRLLGTPGFWIELQLRRTNWLTLIAAGTALLLWKRRTAAIFLFLAVYFGLIDNGIAFGAIFTAQLLASCHGWLSALRQTPVRRRRSSESVESAERPRTGVSAKPEPPVARVIGSGTSARTPSHWRSLLTHHPILLALATRFIPHEDVTAFEAVGYHRLLPIRFLITSFLSWCLWPLLYFIATLLAAYYIIQPLIDHLNLPGLLLGLALTVPLIRSLELLLTKTGRRRIRIRFTRLTHREYWPAELLYWPLAPYFTYLGLKHAPIAFTACNPGIESGGGLIGESKQAILDAMPDSSQWILKSIRIDRNPDPATRIAQALHAITTNPALAFPVILKPDSGYRGFAVKLARSEDDIRAYFRDMLAPAVIQQYHPGPLECGILWARNPADLSGPGTIFSITRKDFPILTGDGRHTFEQLIFRHKRFHAQAGVFLERHAQLRTRILAEGETFRLAESGNHCQGTLFRDGADLITPQLTARIDAIAQSFRGGLDIGRFDVRYTSDEELRQGTGFAILELNGITGESTNIYDPKRSIWWAYAVTMRQWRLMYELGAARMRTGHKSMPVSEVFRRIRAHKRSRSGTALAD